MSDTNLNMGIPKKAELTVISSDNTITHDVSEEFSLPDYVPEVRKILSTRASVLPESKFISDSQNGASVDFGGTVTYSVMYADDEGKIRCVPLSSSYETSSVLPTHSETVFIDTSSDSVVCRVNAPRKLTLKSRLKSRIVCFDKKEISENIQQKSSSDEFFIERMSEKVNTVRVLHSIMQNIKVSDKFDTSSLKNPNPIWCDATIYINDCQTSNGSVSARGNVCVKCLCEDEGKTTVISKVCPIYEEIPTENANGGDMCRSFGRCVSLSVSSEQNENSNQIFFDIDCEIECEVYSNEENMLTKDCYSTKCEMETSFKNIDLYNVKKATNASFTFNESVKRKNADGDEIIFCSADPVCEKTDVSDRKLTMNGHLDIDVISKTKADENKNSEFISEEYEIPFKYETDIPTEVFDANVISNIAISDLNARFDQDKLKVSAEIYPSYAVIEKSQTKILDTATVKRDKEFKSDSSCVKVFFPKENDTLWEVAKKYHTTSKKIVEDNALETFSIDGIKSIII